MSDEEISTDLRKWTIVELAQALEELDSEGAKSAQQSARHAALLAELDSR